METTELFGTGAVPIREVPVYWPVEAYARPDRTFVLPRVSTSMAAGMHQDDVVEATHRQRISESCWTSPYGQMIEGPPTKAFPPTGHVENSGYFFAWQMLGQGARHILQCRLLKQHGVDPSSIGFRDSSRMPQLDMASSSLEDTSALGGASNWSFASFQFPSDILPNPSIEIIDTDRGEILFRLSVALMTGVIYSIQFTEAAFQLLSFEVLAWRLSKVISQSSTGMRLPILARFTPDHPSVVLGCTNGTIDVIELFSKDQGMTLHHERQMDIFLPAGFVTETLLMPDHNLLSKIKGLIPWNVNHQAQVAQGGGANGLSSSVASSRMDHQNQDGVDFNPQQILSLLTIVSPNGQIFIISWSRDQTLRLWKSNHNKCIRALHLPGDDDSRESLSASIETYLQTIHVQGEHATFIVRTNATEPSTFALCSMNMQSNEISLMNKIEIRAECVTRKSAMYDFSSRLISEHSLEIGSLWTNEERGDCFGRIAIVPVNSRHSGSQTTLSSWTTILKSPEPPSQRISPQSDFATVVRFIKQCPNDFLLVQTYRQYTGGQSISHFAAMTLDEIRSVIIETIQQQASSSKALSDRDAVHYQQSLLLEANRFASCLSQLLDFENVLCGLGYIKGDLFFLRLCGFSAVKQIDSVEAMFYHVHRESDISTHIELGPLLEQHEAIVDLLDLMVELVDEVPEEMYSLWTDTFRDAFPTNDPQLHSLWSFSEQFSEDLISQVDFEFTTKCSAVPIEVLSQLVAVLQGVADYQMQTQSTDSSSLLFISTFYAAIGSTAFIFQRLCTLLVVCSLSRLLSAEPNQQKYVSDTIRRLVFLLGQYETISLHWQYGHLQKKCYSLYSFKTLHFLFSRFPQAPTGPSFKVLSRMVSTYLPWLISGDQFEVFCLMTITTLLECKNFEGALEILRLHSETGWRLFALGEYYWLTGDVASSCETFEKFAPVIIQFSQEFEKNKPFFDLFFHVSRPLRLYEYYENRMKVFEEGGAIEEASRFGKLALGAVETMETEHRDHGRQRILVNLFLLDLQKMNYTDSLAYLQDLVDAESRNSCLKSLIVSMCENGMAYDLCKLSFLNMEKDVISNLIFKARNSSILSAPNYYFVLYSFFTIRGDYQNAAKWMCQFGLLIRRNQSLEPSASLEAETKAYLVAINVLRLVPDGCAWIALDKHVLITSRPGVDDFLSPILTLDDIRERYLVNVAHLKLRTMVDGMDLSRRSMSAKEAIALYNGIEEFEKAAHLCTQLNLPLNSVFKALASHCIRHQLRHPSAETTRDSWALLYRLLTKHTQSDCTYASIVLNVILDFEPNFNVFPWLTALFKNDHGLYLRSLLKRHLLAPAVRYSVQLLDEACRAKQMVKQEQQDALPFSSIDRLLFQLKQHVPMVEKEERERLLDRLQTCLNRYMNQIQAVALK